MIHDFTKTATLSSAFDDENQQLIVAKDIHIDETLIRRMKEMRNLFINSEGYDDDYPLYYMYNGIYKEKDREFFKQQGIKYEYTVLPALLIHDEYLKVHGHVHEINPIRKARHIEAYEILYGEGYFELFRYRDANTIEVVLIKVKPNDYFIIPSDYYHLAMNTGSVPLIYGDLIINGACNDYTPLKQRNGAPYFVVRDPKDRPVFRENKHYDDLTIDLLVTDSANLPWNRRIDAEPLYTHFCNDPAYFSFLK